MTDTLLQSIITGVLMGFIYALIAVGLSIIYGVMNVVNFAHGDFVMLSMYLSYMAGTLLVWDAVATPLITVPLLFLFGFITYYLLIDKTLRQMYVVQLAVTVGLQIFLRSLALIIWKAQPRALQYSLIQGNIQIFGYSILTSRLIAAIVSLIFIAAIAYFLNKTWAGAAIRAASDDLDTASLMGVNYHRTYALTFAIGAALTAGDPLARAVLEETVADLAFGLSHAVHLLHPALVVLGGGLSLLGEPLRAAVAAALPDLLMEAFRPGPAVALAALAEDAVPVGALLLAAAAAAKS
jgi:branched-subunit amino acid ABC-type transport system permease component